MTEESKHKVGRLVADALGFSGCDVLYVPEEWNDPDRTSESISQTIVDEVVNAITRIETEEAQGKPRAMVKDIITVSEAMGLYEDSER